MRRFSRSTPCPICGGYDQAPRGEGQRCHGFLSDDGDYAHCAREEHASALSVEPNSSTYAHRLAGDCRCGQQHGPSALPGCPRPSANGQQRRIVATYDYRDESGVVLYKVNRFEPKDFRPRRPDGAGWVRNLDGVRRLPYRLPDLLAKPDGQVFICEGEKDADRLAALGLLATTNDGGAGKWRPTHADVLAGRDVVILPDNDEKGRKHAEQVAQSHSGKAASVRVLPLPDLPPKGDVSDWLAAGGTADALQALVRDAPEWEPAFRSATHEGEVPAERMWHFRTAREIAESAPQTVDWIAEPWVARGAITGLDGKIKSAGKTTWAFALSRAVVDGLPFLGKPTKQGKVVYLTEQGDTSLREALRRAGLLDCDHLVLLSWHETRGRPWPDIVQAAVREALRREATLLVVDTIAQFAGLGGDDENSAGAALAAMAPLQEAAAVHGLAVLLTRHERKSGGDVGDSGRGSSAFAGTVDVVLSLRRGEGNSRPSIRVLRALSRFSETPDTLIIELDGDAYRALGDESAVALHDAREAILQTVPSSSDQAMPLDALLDGAKVMKRTVAQEAIQRLINEGELRRVGAGKKGDPFRYCLANHAAGTGEVPAACNPDGPMLSAAASLLRAAARNESDGRVRI